MASYRVFGLRLDSELPFPELASDGGGSDRPLHIRRASVSSSMQSPALIGRIPTPPCDIQLFRHAGGYRMYHHCTGTHDLRLDEFSLTCAPAPHTSDEALRLDVLGRMIPLALHERGAVVLHASGVVLEGSALAFLAPKGTGKSTMALALVNRGARLLTDDALAIDVTRGALAMPGVPRLRLRDDVNAAAAGPTRALRAAYDGKFVLDGSALHEHTDEPAPLVALYVLQPVASVDGAAPVRRERLSTRNALAALMGNGKLGALLGGVEGLSALERMAALVASVPVYRLLVTRDLSRLNEGAQSIVAWHADASKSCA